MTNEFAIERLKLFVRHYEGENREVFNKAIEALEKQIPKKPRKTYLCPACSAAVGVDIAETVYSLNLSIEYQANFCPSCGQAIDWSKDEVRREQK